MTEAASTPVLSGSRFQLALHYFVAMPQPESHLFEVRLEVQGWDRPILDLKMPVWTPGSYLVREYARHLQDFRVDAEHPLSWHKVGKNHWQIQSSTPQALTVSYRIFANELTVRTNHLDSTHGYFNPAALCFYIPGFEHTAIALTISPPRSTWRIATALPPVPGEPNTFHAADFDTLVDSPVEVGEHQLYEFEVLGKPHQFAIWGAGNVKPNPLILDTQRIIEAEAALFGGLPYSQYLFLLHLSSNGFGGLEHKNSCTLNYSRFGFRTAEKYQRLMQLVAHEFFHLWNVKHIRPKALETFDYNGENYTPSLWFSEGTTSYYDLVFPLRAGIYSIETYLKNLSKEITRFLTIPGRKVQPLSESSFDAWIKLYRRDANSDNSQISYYLKGEMVSLLLDLLIRQRHHNGRSLDDVLRRLWHDFGKDEVGFTPEQLQAVIESVAETDLAAFFHRYLHTTEDLPFDEYLHPFGLRLEAESTAHLPPLTGMTVHAEHGRDMIKFVEAGSPAQRAGLDAGDELLALNGIRVTADQFNDRLKDFAPGETIAIAAFHQDELKTVHLTLAAPRPAHFRLVPVEHPTAEQERLFAGWLSASLSDL